MGAILENCRKAEMSGRPMCQDTGVAIFWVRGRIDPGIRADIERALRNST